MRPISLTMEAFGPFAATQTIDFSALGDATFLLIHGPTGAGKTSILDAMCVALYGQTTGSERTAEQMRSQFAEPDRATSLTFEFAIGADTYRVERRPRQPRPAARASGKMVDAQPTATLWRTTGRTHDGGPGDVLATGVQAVTQHVEGLLGFSVEQFRQVVMLPQGRFRELLSAKSTERQQILEELFGAQLYGAFEDFLKGKKKGAAELLRETGIAMEETLRSQDVETAEELEALLEAAAGARDAAAGAERTARSNKEAAEKAHAEGAAAANLIGAALKARDACVEAERGVVEAQDALREASGALQEERLRDPQREATRATMDRLRDLADKVEELGELTERLRAARVHRDEAEEALASAVEGAGTAAAVLAELADRRSAAAEAASRLAAEGPALRLEEARLRDLQALRALDEQIDQAGEREIGARTAHKNADDDLRRALDELDAMEREWRVGQASVLAATLVEGAPCPVCGSTEHPAPAHAAAAVVPTEEIDGTRARVDGLRAATSAAGERLSGARTAVESLRERRAEMAAVLGDDHPAATASDLVSTIREQEGRVAERRELVGTLASAAALPPDHGEREAQARASADAAAEATRRAEDALAAAKEEVSACEGSLRTRERDVPEEFRAPGALATALAEAEDRMSRLQEAVDRAAGAERAAMSALDKARALHEREARCAEEAEGLMAGVEPPDLPALERAASAARDAWEAALTESKGAGDRHDALTKTLSRVGELHDRFAALESEYSVIALLSDTASGRSTAFQRWVLGVFLDEVLVAATRRLLEMSRGRYRLHQAAGPLDGRRVGGLDVEVFDEFTGHDRPASTLSGGEGFLASLALALGLAEVVQNFSGGIRLDTVFIDEGFGTLDPEALDAAIQTLLDLREHGRLVGVISHVPELRERIDCRLEVRPTPRGSTATLVVP